MDLQETVFAIAEHGKLQQRLGDMYTKEGQNEQAAKCYLRAKVAREDGLLLQSVAEVSDPLYCRSVQELLASATQYQLVKWCDYTPEQC